MKLAMCASTLVLLVNAGASACVSYGDDPLTWITDIRRGSSSYSGNGSGSSWQDRPTAFAPFQGGADLLVTNGLETWAANCLQDSELDGASASFVSSADATIIADMQSNPLLAQSQSKMDTWFSIAEPMHYTLTGEVSESGHEESMAMVRLTDINGNIIERVISGVDSSRVFRLSGVLQPGTYRLYSEALGKCRTLPLGVFSEGHAGCRMDFSVAAEGDTPPEDEPRPVTISSTGSPPPRPQ